MVQIMMIQILFLTALQVDFNDKALDLLTSAGRNQTAQVVSKYKGDPDFTEIRGGVGVIFIHKDYYATSPLPSFAWKCESEEERKALRTKVLGKVLPMFQDYQIGSTDITKPRGEAKIWKETIRIDQKIDGYYQPFNFATVVLNYQTGKVILGEASLVDKPFRMPITVTDEKVRARVEQDGKPDKLEIVTQWFAYNTVFAWKGSEEHKLDVVLVTFATAKRGKVETTYLFDQEGGVQVNPLLKSWKPNTKKPPVP